MGVLTQERKRGREGKMKVVHLPASAKGSEARARERGVVLKERVVSLKNEATHHSRVPRRTAT